MKKTKLEKSILKIAKNIWADYKWDPEHIEKPDDGGTWYKTNRGWSDIPPNEWNSKREPVNITVNKFKGMKNDFDKNFKKIEEDKNKIVYKIDQNHLNNWFGDGLDAERTTLTIESDGSIKFSLRGELMKKYKDDSELEGLMNNFIEEALSKYKILYNVESSKKKDEETADIDLEREKEFTYLKKQDGSYQWTEDGNPPSENEKEKIHEIADKINIGDEEKEKLNKAIDEGIINKKLLDDLTDYTSKFLLNDLTNSKKYDVEEDNKTNDNILTRIEQSKLSNDSMLKLIDSNSNGLFTYMDKLLKNKNEKIPKFNTIEELYDYFKHNSENSKNDENNSEKSEENNSQNTKRNEEQKDNESDEKDNELDEDDNRNLFWIIVDWIDSLSLDLQEKIKKMSYDKIKELFLSSMKNRKK